jgi:hypothetical protein
VTESRAKRRVSGDSLVQGRRGRRLLGVVLIWVALFAASAPGSNALDVGMMSGDSSWEEPGQWDIIQKSGASVFRAGVSALQWENSVSRKKIEDLFRYTAERGIVVLPYLYGRPESGSQQFPTEAEWKPQGNKWETFVYGIVQRFGYNGTFWSENPNLPYHPVGAWEVWNEPNLPVNNPGGASAQPENYARFLNRTSKAVRSAQASMSSTSTQVVFGGLYSQGGMSVGEFLKKASNVAETGSEFDALSLHPYSFTGGVAGFQANVNGARSNLNSYFGNKSLWLTEVGWNVKPWAESDAAHPPVSVEQQTQYLSESLSWIKAVASEKNIHLYVWYFYRDNGTCTKWDCHTGLREAGANGGYRASWYAFQAGAGAPEWPYRWQANNLGGISTSDPDMLSYGPGSLEVFARGSDGALWTRNSGGGGWNNWSSVAGSVVGGPGAVFGGGKATVVSRVSGFSSITSWWWDNGTWNSFGLGGNNTSDPDLSAWGTARMDMFVRGSDNALWHRPWINGTWGNWESLGGNLSSGPAAVSWGSNRIDVVALNNDANRTLSHWWYDGSWHCCENLGGVNTSDPDIASTASGRLSVFVRGSDFALWHLRYEEGKGWIGWERIGGSLSSGPGAVSWGQNERLDVVAQANDHSLTHWWWGPGGG